MSCSKKDYEAIAKEFRVELEPRRIAKGIATYFESTNPDFDRERFLAACGYPARATA